MRSPIDAENLTESTNKIDGFVIHKRDSPTPRKRKFTSKVITKTPFLATILQRKTEQLVTLPEIPIHKKYFVPDNRGSTKSLVQFLFPNHRRGIDLPIREI